MDLYCIKLLNNLFINELLANKANIKEVGTLISENEIKFIINTKDENHIFINEIARNTFEVKYIDYP